MPLPPRVPDLSFETFGRLPQPLSRSAHEGGRAFRALLLDRPVQHLAAALSGLGFEPLVLPEEVLGPGVGPEELRWWLLGRCLVTDRPEAFEDVLVPCGVGLVVIDLGGWAVQTWGARIDQAWTVLELPRRLPFRLDLLPDGVFRLAHQGHFF